MAIELKRLTHYSGEKASVYAVLNTANNTHPFADFLRRYAGSIYEDKAMNLVGRIKSMGTKTGVIDEFLKLNESEIKGKAENMCALFDKPKKEMRLFCIKISNKIIVIGDGAPKPPNIIKWQQCPTLSKAARYMMLISEAIKSKVNSGSLSISSDGMSFKGNLKIA